MTEEAKSANEMDLEQTMCLIVNAGNARAFAKEAVDAAHNGDLKLAHEKLAAADKAIVVAHNSQISMLTKEANGDHVKLTLLVVHAQDHLMTAITFIDLAKELVAVYEKMAE